MVKSETRRDAETLVENLRPRLESLNKIRARVSVPRKPSPRLFCENPNRFPKLLAARHDNELHDIQ